MTSNAELSHQVAERVAVIAVNKREDRWPIYRFVKDCYAFRSKYIHGVVLRESDEPKVTDMCIKLDDLVRRTYLNAIGDEEMIASMFEELAFDEFILKKVFL